MNGIALTPIRLYLYTHYADNNTMQSVYLLADEDVHLYSSDSKSNTICCVGSSRKIDTVRKCVSIDKPPHPAYWVFTRVHVCCVDWRAIHSCIHKNARRYTYSRTYTYAYIYCSVIAASSTSPVYPVVTEPPLCPRTSSLPLPHPLCIWQ